MSARDTRLLKLQDWYRSQCDGADNTKSRADRQSESPAFYAAVGPGELDEILTTFLDWAEASASNRT